MAEAQRLAPLLLLSACVVTGDAGRLTADGGADLGGTGSADGGTTPSTSGDESSGDGMKLDVSTPDVETTECASVGQTTTIEERPSDIIVVVDRHMNPDTTDPTFQNFAQLIANDGIEDVRVVMIAGYPPDGICIDEPPLGTGMCPTTDDNPPVYRHLDVVIAGDTLLTQVLDEADQWAPLLRPQARTHVLVVASGDATLPVADFDAELRMHLPAPTYTFHAMAPGPEAAGRCSAVLPGQPWSAALAYEAHAAATGGVFEDACDYSVKVLFDDLLERITAVALACEYDIPAPPDGMVFDQGKVNVDYDDGFGLQTVGFVESAADCPGVTNGWYYDDPVTPSQILMCPQTCSRFELLQNASIEIRFGCTTIPAG